MARISGINIPSNKRIETSLTYIKGVGKATALKVLAKAGVNPDTRAKDLTTEEEDKLRNIIEKELITEGELKRRLTANVRRLKDIGAYRGLRHSRGLPVRGQRTKTNSRTVRGNKRSTMGSGRKPTGQKT